MGDRDVHLKAVASPFPLFLLYEVTEERKWQRKERKCWISIMSILPAILNKVFSIIEEYA